MKNYLISILGPTAIGKTALSIELATHFNTEIFSCDSRQFFKEMNIGTAVPLKKELIAVKHHFIQIKSIFENYSVGEFEKEALKTLQEFYKNHTIAVLVGGSGLYVNAVLDGLDYFPKVNPTIREKLNEEILNGNISKLQNQLKKLDFESYQTIAIDNPHRLIRALEICIGTQKPYSSFKNKNKIVRNFVPIKIGLFADKEVLYNRINKRVDLMMENGLLEEAKKLFPYKNLNALQTVGYKELFNYFEGKCTLDFAISEIKKNSRRFAKRQLTWNRKDTRINWFHFETPITEIIKNIESKMKNE